MTNVPAARDLRDACPLLVDSRAGGTVLPLGSSFVLAGDWPAPVIVSAAHVVRDAESGGAPIAALMASAGAEAMQSVLVEQWHVRDDVDVAVGRLHYGGAEGLLIDELPFPVNADVVTLEHSDSISAHHELADTHVVTPLLRKGYMVQVRRGLLPDRPQQLMLELSYPALKGASGSPVFTEDGSGILGMVIANRGRELMPAQVLRTYADDGTPLEEVSFHLPNAIAVHRSDILEAVREAQGLW